MPNDCCTSCCIDGTDCEVVKAVQGHSSLLRQIFASSAGSIISTLSLNPIAVVKVRLQNLPAVASSSGSGVISAGGSPLRGVIRTIIAQGGLGGFWAGTRTGIIMSVPNTVLYMSVYEKLKEVLMEDPSLKAVRPVAPALAGALARMVSVTIISPLELIRTIQTGGAKDSLGTIARSIVQKEGIRGMYRGWLPSVLRDCPYSAIYWFGFESLRPVYGQALLPPSPDPQVAGFPAYITFLSGATAGMAAAVTTHPFDVLKTRQQVSAWAATSAPAAAVSNSATTASTAAAVLGGAKLTIGGIYRREGFLALYRGLSMRLATVIPASAIMVTIYETIKTWDL